LIYGLLDLTGVLRIRLILRVFLLLYGSFLGVVSVFARTLALPINCLDDRALRRHIHRIPPHYLGNFHPDRYLSDPDPYLMPNAELRTIHYEIQAFGDHLLQFSKILVKETDKKQSFTAKKGVRSILLVPVA